ncbi:hypothetical protein LCGC14_1377000 [marine sediment metagenome]|uniref:Uncharacterized protein n=1 Tax=marine sediment metagenome TaxID=412755 RepID=A0A0F9K448_9ZZZZ
MAENERCSVIREVGGDQSSQYSQADHHEWRFLRQGIVYKDAPTSHAVHDVYYCIFCLKLNTRKVE